MTVRVDPQLDALHLFAAWTDWPTETRDAQLAKALDDSPALEAAVRRLIDGHARAAILPTEPPPPVSPAAHTPVPARVGAYRLAEKIGEGGMGLVFRGERDDGVFAQTVAVKLIRRSLFSASAAAQFAEERQILARLRHPHIAQLFDGGVTTDGDSFIVMELIAGRSIVDHCRNAGIDRRGRVALMRDVCDAVQFAHQQLIVHADIKPSNVVIDAEFGVKLLDFGIARIIDDRPDEGTGRGRTAGFASPQQAAGAPTVPADDVFALGRLLAVLVDDGIPIDAELAAVIARATVPEPEHRYPAASALADDLSRWRDGRPVRAKPAARGRTARMFVRRHRFGVVFAASALIALVAATAISSTLYVRAETARRQSDARFAEVRRLSDYLLTDVTDALQQFPGTSHLRHSLAVRGRAYLETLSGIPGAPPAMRLEVARGYTKTANILGRPAAESVGDPRGAKHDLAIAEARLRQLLVETHDRADVEVALAQALTVHGSIVHVSDNDVKLATRLFIQACRLADAARAQDETNSAAIMAKVGCLSGLAITIDYEGRYDRIAPPLAAAFAALRLLPTDDTTDRVLAQGNLLMLQGNMHYYQVGMEASLPDYRAAAALFERHMKRSADVRLSGRLVAADSDYASVLADLGRSDEALAAINRAVAVADSMRAFERSPRAVYLATWAHIQRAVQLGTLHRYPQAIAEAEATIGDREAESGRYPDNYELARGVPVNRRPLGELYWGAGQHAKACRAFARTNAEWARLARQRGLTGFDASDELKVVARLLERCRRQGIAT